MSILNQLDPSSRQSVWLHLLELRWQQSNRGRLYALSVARYWMSSSSAGASLTVHCSFTDSGDATAGMSIA